MSFCLSIIFEACLKTDYKFYNIEAFVLYTKMHVRTRHVPAV